MLINKEWVFEPLIDLPIFLAYGMIIFAAIGSIGYGIKKIIQNTNNSNKTLYTAGGLVVAFLISYLLASGDVLNSYEKYDISSLTSKLVGAGLYSYSILLSIAFSLILIFAFMSNWKQAIVILISLIILIGFVFNASFLAISITYIMILIALLSIAGFSIKQMMQNTNNAKNTLYTLGGLISLFIIAYVLADGEVLNSYEKYEISQATSRQVGMGLITFYFLIIGTIGTILYTELSKTFSK
jgi:hypothetical protein